MTLWIVSMGEASLDILENIQALFYWNGSDVMDRAVQNPNDIEAQLVHPPSP